ncbi:MAG: phosphate ABC transporter ATP-binding protein [Crenarchaeota archaeon]|nr:phosphate ABC transporter ATP-binding protein [Thermoproteota archaeon]
MVRARQVAVLARELGFDESKPAVEIRGLRVWIGGSEILKGVSATIPPRGVTVVLGPSGSGKSTLLRCINRMIDLVPEARVDGVVRVFGVDVRSVDPYELRKRVGMVFQIPNPFPHMSIYENVAIAAKIAGVARGRRELDEVVRWALERAMLWDEVRDRLGDPPSRLSGGQQQRLCLARALAMKPRLLLLDEPTANIDPENSKKIEESIKALVREEGVSVVFVTHSPHQAARIADYLVVVYRGLIVEEGPAREVIESPRHEVTRSLLSGAM